MASGDGVGQALFALLGFHCDGFNPLRSRPNDFSLTYGILRCFVGPEVPIDITCVDITGYVWWQLSSSRAALKMWFLTQGPAHCKSTSWFDDRLVDQVVQVFEKGFQTTWQHPSMELGGELA